MCPLHRIDNSLFLDRDGVLNRRIVDGYVTRPDEFEILPGVLDAMKIFATHFKHIFIVTNQQGIGKGLMTESDLLRVHDVFLQQVEKSGGRVDHIYYCPALKSAHSFQRKPSIGMAIQARRDYAGVSLKQSVMVGDMMSDMLFGRRAGMTTVLVGDEPQTGRLYPHLVDYYYPSLVDYAKTLRHDKTYND